MGARVLVVGPPVERDWVADLEAEGCDVEERTTTTRATLSTLGKTDIDCVVVDRGDTPSEQGGVAADEQADGVADPTDVLAAIREFGYDEPTVLVSETPDGELAAAATRLGVDEYYPRSTADEPLVDRVLTHLPAAEPTVAGDGHGQSSTDADGSADGAGLRTESTDSSSTIGERMRRDKLQDTASGDSAGGLDGPGEQGGDPSLLGGGLEQAASALNVVGDGLYVLDMQGEFVVVNDSLAEMTGYGVDELVGEHVSAITTESPSRATFPEVRRLVRDEAASATVTTTIVPRDSEPFPAEDHITAVTEDDTVVGIAGVIRDISDKRERTRELERYESVIEAVDDGVYALDDEGQFEVVNDALVELTGYDREELLGEHTSLIKDEQTVQRAENKLRELIHGNFVETTFELALQRKSGDAVEAEDHMVMLSDEDGEFDGTAGVIRDITERKEREHRLRRARERFAELLDSSRALLGAHSRERAAEVVADAVAETLGYRYNIVRLYDAETDRIEPVAGSGSGPNSVQRRPPYESGEGGPGRAFETGETLHAPSDFDIGPDNLPGPVVETLYVPLGDQGTLSIGATEPDAFDELDRSLAEILASNAAVALDRVDFESELVQYRTVLENVQDMVYVADESGRFSLVTEPLASWLGVERGDLIGSRVVSVLADESAFDAAVADVRDGRLESQTVETTFERDDGEALPGEVEVSPLPSEGGVSGTVGVVRDRSELVETRERLETQRDRFTYLFDNLPDAVVEASLETGGPIVTSVNDAFTDVFGYDSATISGEPLNDYILPDDDSETGQRLDQAAVDGEVVQREVRRKTADGYRDFLFRGVPFDTGADRINSFGIYTDISDQKERERRLQVLNRVLRHNLRNDLNVVLGYAEMIAERVDDDTINEWAETLIETASDVASLSDRARSLARTMREGSLREGTVAVRDVVDEVVETYRTEHDDVSVESDLDDATIVGDARIELALTELFENSVEYGGDEVRIRVTADRDGERVELSVADDGPGIPEHERGIVDEPSEITQLEHGSGLGLWIVRWVCDSCGGRLYFEESDLGGTRVVLSLTAADE